MIYRAMWRGMDIGMGAAMLAAAALTGELLCACGGGGAANIGTSPPPQPAAAPTVATAAALNGAVVVSLASSTPGATIYYTVDGSTPTSSSQIYQAPFLLASNLTVKAIAQSSAGASSVASQAFNLNIPSGALVWSDEFANATGSNAQPNQQVWTYETGNSGFGNSELETYCAWGSNASARSPARVVGVRPVPERESGRDSHPKPRY